ncbi:MAG: sulfotransferase family protein [Pseudomonadota bacterium]
MFRHLHIVACSPRSGTTLLHEVMVTCFEVGRHYDHEVRFNLVDADVDGLLLTKRPKDVMYMPEVIDDPGVFVLYLMRDPRDVICSRHGKDKDIYYSNIRLWRELHGYAKAITDHANFLQVNYEDFVTDPDATQQSMIDRWPWLVSKHAFSEYHLHAKVSEKSKLAMHNVRPIAPSSVGLWQRNLPRILAQQQIHGSLTADLIEAGYAASADWEQQLVGVIPDRTRGRYPEKLYWHSRISQKINALRKVAMYKRLRRRGRST